MAHKMLDLQLRSQVLTQDAGGHNCWEVQTLPVSVPAGETALLICDVWDAHWSRGAAERVDAMAGRMNEVIKAARRLGIQIIHAPSDTMDYYAGNPGRLRISQAPRVDPPEPQAHDDPPLPIDDSDHGSDTGETTCSTPWTRQHPAIEIDQERDVISDDGPEVYSWMQGRGIKYLLIMGVHTNMCVLNRSFGIKQMVRWGVRPALVRDLTDAMYNPARPPYVSHEEGTRLVVEYIEKFWCPTISSEEILAGG
jgi:nicotinamidase-related amidase